MNKSVCFAMIYSSLIDFLFNISFVYATQKSRRSVRKKWLIVLTDLIINLQNETENDL